LLAYLLLHRETPLSRDFLAYLMWPDDTEESARTKLRANLYDLLRVLPPAPAGQWLEVDGNTLRWNPAASLRLDVDEFVAAASNPRSHEEAIEVYGGELLAQLYDEWIFPIRERLRNLYLATLSQAISSARRRLDFPRAIAHAQALLALEPFREDIVRRLVALRNESGDRAGALDEFRRFAQYVRAELGIDPMPETLAVRDAIARDEFVENDKESDDDAPAVAAERAPALPFVGRHVEIEQLLDAWSRAARGRGGVFFVGGEAGIGKTRLALELVHAVEERGGRVLIGTTGSPEVMPYQSIVTALRSALPLVESLRIGEVWLSTLATLLPELANRKDSLPPPRVDPAGERARLLEALTRAVVGLARVRPVLLVLEDLHWAEEATVAALAFLLRRVALAPILVVATFRDDETPRIHPLQRLRRDAGVHGARSLSLRPLTLDDLAELEPLLGFRTKRPAKALLAESEGNPLFLTQLLEDDTTDAVAQKGGLRALVARRIERLSSNARTIAEIAALIGAQFSGTLARDVCGWNEAAVGEALAELIDHRIVRETAGRGLFDYSFGHEIVREVVAGLAPENRAIERHRRIAVVLEELAPERSEEIAAEVARHYELAGDETAAARHYLVAGRRSIELGALDAAGTQLARALALSMEARLHADALLERDRLARRLGDRTLREDSLRELEALAEKLRDDELRRTVFLRRLEFARDNEDEDAHRAALPQLRALISYDQPRWRGILQLEESHAAYDHGDLDQAYASAAAALAAYREANDSSGAARSLLRLAEVETQRGRLDGAETLLVKARETAEQARDGTVEIETFLASFYLAYSRRDLAQCLATGERWLERGIELGDRLAESKARVLLAVSLVALRERYAEARENFALAEAFYDEVNDRRGRASVFMNRAVMSAALCDFSAARDETARALEIFESLHDVRGTLLGRSNVALLEAVAGDPVHGAANARAALELARTGDYGLLEASALENLAIAEALMGHVDAAIEHGEEALLVRTRSQSDAWSGKALADLALWYAARGDLATARERIERMLANEPYDLGTEWPQTCHWAAARILRASGESARAGEALARAKSLVDGCAAQIEPQRRDRYLNISWNREIADAAERDAWPESFTPTEA